MTWQSSIPTDPNPALVRDRMFSQLLEAERAAKQDALAQVDAFRKMLFQIAQQVDGESVQSLQRAAPGVFQTYTPAQWFLFFEGAIRRKAAFQAAPEINRGVLNAEEQEVSQGLEAKLVGVREQLEREQHMVRDLRAKLEETNRALQTARSQLLEQTKQRQDRRTGEKKRGERSNKGNRQASVESKQQPAASSSAAEEKLSVPPGPIAAEVLAKLMEWQAPSCPARFRRRFSEDEGRYQRQCKALYLLATEGYGSRLEIEYLVSLSEQLKSRPGSMRDTIAELCEKGLVIEQSVRFEMKGFSTSLTLMRLSDEGKELCGLLGWDVVESEWERLLAKHEGERFPMHTLGVLVFTLHARLRGWRTTILPVVLGHAAPDVLIEKDAERYYVEVEMGDRQKDDKWRSLAAKQGKIALCAGTIAHRKQLTTDCRRMHLNGLATDLESLVQQRIPIEKPEVFWEETW